MRACFDGRRLSLEEAHRLSNGPVRVLSSEHWDALLLFAEIKRGLALAARPAGLDGIGLDTWGLGFGLLDRDDQLVGNPYHYRHVRTDGMPERDIMETQSMPTSDDPTQSYLPALMAGNMAELVAGFGGEPLLDDPLAGHVAGVVDFQRFAAERRAWLEERAARVEPLRTTRNEQRTVVENLLHLRLPSGQISLPVAVAGEHGDTGWLKAIRVYHSLWPLFGEHRVRPALLKPDLERHLSGAVADYQRALAIGDVDAIVNTFEPDGYFREPAGGEYIYQGLERLREFMSLILSAGGITLEHCTVTDDGIACALEFNAVAFGTHPLVPQAGVAVYERGATGRLHGARIYDDVNVEAYAGSAKD